MSLDAPLAGEEDASRIDAIGDEDQRLGLVDDQTTIFAAASTCPSASARSCPALRRGSHAVRDRRARRRLADAGLAAAAPVATASAPADRRRDRRGRPGPSDGEAGGQRQAAPASALLSTSDTTFVARRPGLDASDQEADSHRTTATIRMNHRMWAAKPSPPKMARISSNATNATIPLLLLVQRRPSLVACYPRRRGDARRHASPAIDRAADCASADRNGTQHPPAKISRLAPPMQSHFRLEVRNQGRATVIAVSGELDLASSPALQEELDRVAASDSKLLIIDLRELDFMDSTGLSVLVRAHQRAEEQGRQLAMVKGPQQVQRLLSLTGVGDRLTLVDAPEELLPTSELRTPASQLRPTARRRVDHHDVQDLGRRPRGGPRVRR